MLKRKNDEPRAEFSRGPQAWPFCFLNWYRTFSDDNPNSPFFEDTLTVSPKNDVGFFGGIKLGYVFGTGVFRPTLEGDFFYNGFRGGADFALRRPMGI